MAKTSIGYIIKQDITKHLLSETLSEMTGGVKAIGDTAAVAGTDSIWQNLRNTAIEIVKGYLRHWYDADTEMREYYSYDIAEAYTEGDRVASDEVAGVRTLYLCIQDAAAGTSLTDTDYYTEADDRNPVVLECAITYLIYSLFKRVNPRQIPEQRQIDYNHCMDMLKDIQKGRLTLDISERADVEADDPGHQTAYGDFDDVTQDTY